MSQQYQLEINQTTCDWTARLMSILENSLGINIKLHSQTGDIQNGDIFLFNHFARFETFIPQHLIYQRTGVMCRSIASSEFFQDDDSFGRYLLSLGAVPNDHERLLPFLAEEILRGRKVVIFPEGGMVKDRLVMNHVGDYSMFSKTTGERGPHHTGAAALGMSLQMLKSGLLYLDDCDEKGRLDDWAERLEFDNRDLLIKACTKPTAIVPANITFYPIRLRDNILRKGAEIFTGNLKDSHVEELLIEGNILLKNTDMDIRLAKPVYPHKKWQWWQRLLLHRIFKTINSTDELFDLYKDTNGIARKILSRSAYQWTLETRQECMEGMYGKVSLNLAHLASLLVLHFVDSGQMKVPAKIFNTSLYLAIKSIQQATGVDLHRSLNEPARYQGIIEGNCRGLERFLTTANNAGLVEHTPEYYLLSNKLLEEHSFDEIRLENPILVSANEAMPIEAAKQAIEAAIQGHSIIQQQDLARHFFEDELRSFEIRKKKFEQPEYQEINLQETATQSPLPYLLLPADKSNPAPKKTGVILVHGFLASPAELRQFGQKLNNLGYTVLGVRLGGHGTSPYDLKGRTWQDWMAPVRRGYEIMSLLTPAVALVGFSTGGTLSLILAAEKPEKLAGVSIVSSPMKFRNRNLVFVPLVHGVNKMTRWMTSLEGIMPFRPNDSEHPDINYRNIPIRGLYELRKLVEAARKKLSSVMCPVQIIQGSEDRVVDPVSAKILHKYLGSGDKSITYITTKRHGILNENIDNTQQSVIDFIETLEASQ